MPKMIFITLSVFIFSVVEFLLFNTFGRWVTPNFLLLLIIFFNLYLGIRFSLYTAVMAGIFKDSFGISVFGINLFSFVICAFAAAIIKRYLYRRGSRSLRLVLVFLVVGVNFFVHSALQLMFGPVGFWQSLYLIFLPQLAATLFVATHTFYYLKQCASKLSVYLS